MCFAHTRKKPEKQAAGGISRFSTQVGPTATRASTAPAALDRLRALHPYEVPELVSLEASAADPYLHWLTSHCSP